MAIMETEAIKLAKLYFDYSNRSDMEAIASLMTEYTTYSSVRQGVFLGVDQIIDMQIEFHGAFEYLYWDILAIDEIRPGVVYIDFSMRGQKKDELLLEIEGDEYVVVKDGKFQHVEVRNKGDNIAMSVTERVLRK